MKISSAVLKAAFLIGSATLISACGGSGGGTVNSSGGSNGTPTPPPTTAPNTYTLRVPLFYSNGCGDRITHPRAEVVLHDDNWNIISRQTPDANGIAELTVNEPFLNVSIVTTDRAEFDPNDLNGEVPTTTFNIYTSLEMRDYSETHDFLYPVRPSEDSTELCECAEGEFTVSLPGTGYELDSSYHPSLGPGARRVVNQQFRSLFDGTLNDSQTQTETVRVCKFEGNWPVVAVRGNNTTTGHEVLGVVTSFDELQSSGQQVLNVEHEPTNIALTSELGGFDYLRHWNQANEAIYQIQTNTGNAIPYFETEREQSNAIVNNAGILERDLDGVSVTYHKRTFSLDPNDITTLVANYSFPQFTPQELNSLIETNSFDFRNATDFPFFRIDLTYSGAQSAVRFSYNGVPQGTLPGVEQYTGYDALFNNLNAASADLSFTFFDYANIAQKTDTAISTSIFSIQPITAENFQTHYRKDYEYIRLSFDPIPLTQ